MTLADVCIFLAVLLYLLPAGVAKGRGRYDNARPRDPAYHAEGLPARAYGAHQNGLETFAYFATAVLLAEFRGTGQTLVDGLAALFIVIRLGYIAAYMGNRPAARSLVWGLGLAVNTALFFSPLAPHKP